MRQDRRLRIKRILIVSSIIWMVAVTSVVLLTLPRQATLTMESPQIQRELARDCSGTFKQRFRCKQTIILNTSQRTFSDLALRLLAVVAGPIAAAVYFVRYCRPDPIQPRPATPSAPDDMSWKKAAEQRIHQPKSAGDEDDSSDPPPLW